MDEKKNIPLGVKNFYEKFSKIAAEAQKFCYMSRAKELQIRAREELEVLNAEAHKLKEKAIADKQEDTANAMLSIENLIKMLIHELNMWITLKDDDTGSAWNYLIYAQGALRTAMQAHSLACHLDDYVERLYVLEQLLFPPQLFNSPGMIIREAKCSICDQEYGECNHVAGRVYMGEMCTRVITQADLEEVSLVDKPANKLARIISITDEEGIKRDFLTWRIITDTSSELPKTQKNPHKPYLM